ncbi:MAG: polyprenyl synthetase family protein [Coprothermobacterota bacterium]|nr:polyprenyl synthetase family protein [Coprothermobacterota bacterium]
MEGWTDRNELLDALTEVKREVDSYLTASLDEMPIESRAREMLVYAALGEGKRLRPALLLWACQSVGRGSSLPGGSSGSGWQSVLAAAAGVECLHAFSLVHDDLPGMDNADQRRGKPSVHRVFGVGEAILVGDALFALGLQLIARSLVALSVLEACQLMEEACRAVGVEGMIGGQFVDIEARRRDEEGWRWLNERKTARLFQLALRLGTALGGGDDTQQRILQRYGLELGLAFQLVDDLLDLPGEDVLSWARALGPDESRRRVEEYSRSALAHLEGFPGEPRFLRLLVTYLAERKR